MANELTAPCIQLLNTTTHLNETNLKHVVLKVSNCQPLMIKYKFFMLYVVLYRDAVENWILIGQMVLVK